VKAAEKKMFCRCQKKVAGKDNNFNFFSSELWRLISMLFPTASWEKSLEKLYRENYELRGRKHVYEARTASEKAEISRRYSLVSDDDVRKREFSELAGDDEEGKHEGMIRMFPLESDIYLDSSLSPAQTFSEVFYLSIPFPEVFIRKRIKHENQHTEQKKCFLIVCF
jgi:hypothetical protein